MTQDNGDAPDISGKIVKQIEVIHIYCLVYYENYISDLKKKSIEL